LEAGKCTNALIDSSGPRVSSIFPALSNVLHRPEVVPLALHEKRRQRGLQLLTAS
jgi:hypothetical protein